jgi:hypothetical protein
MMDASTRPVLTITSLIEALHEFAAHAEQEAAAATTDCWQNGFFRGRASAFGQAADWLEGCAG